jgi:hypothetical protein
LIGDRRAITGRPTCGHPTISLHLVSLGLVPA